MKKVALIVAGVVAVLMVAGAAFLAARMIFAPEAETGGSGQRMMVGGGGGGRPVGFNLDIEPAPELPSGSPEASGIFVRREDNSIFIGTGEIMIRKQVDPASGQNNMETSYSGPVLEVVVSRDTAIYRDETSFPSPNQANSSGGKVSVQQVVQPVASLSELGNIADNAEFQVWGQRRGDRIVAEVLVYRLPRTFRGP